MVDSKVCSGLRGSRPPLINVSWINQAWRSVCLVWHDFAVTKGKDLGVYRDFL